MWLKGKNKNDAKILTAQLYVTLAWKWIIKEVN